jgi:hypothetical protein
MDKKKSQPSTSRAKSRRDFLKKAAVTPMAASLMDLGPNAAAPPLAQGSSLPWYRRTWRWNQTNINEKDPIRYDIHWQASPSLRLIQECPDRHPSRFA